MQGILAGHDWLAPGLSRGTGILLQRRVGDDYQMYIPNRWHTVEYVGVGGERRWTVLQLA